MTTRVLIADDQQLVRAGLHLILRTEPSIEVVGEAADGAEATALATTLRPDVVLMDIRMPVVNGIDATRRILAATPSVRVLILTTFDRDEYVYEALRAGASGFLLKDAPPEQLVAAVHTVRSGNALLAPSITRRLIEAFASAHSSDERPAVLTLLSPREIEVFRLLGRGMSNQEIAQQLVVAETTVKTHIARVLSKLNLRDRVQAVVLAYEAGIITPGQGH